MKNQKISAENEAERSQADLHGKKGTLRVDIFIWAAVVVIGAALLFVYMTQRKPGSRVIVSVDGKEVASYSLDDEVNDVIEGVEGGTNRLIIHGGEVWIEEASCPDKLCVNQGHISNTAESIVCLPNRVTVRVTGDDDAPDVVVGCIENENLTDDSLTELTQEFPDRCDQCQTMSFEREVTE